MTLAAATADHVDRSRSEIVLGRDRDPHAPDCDPSPATAHRPDDVVVDLPDARAARH